MLSVITKVDHSILLWIQEFLRFDFLNGVMNFISSLGDGGIFWIILSIFLLLSKKTRKVGGLALLSLFIGFLITNVYLKNAVQRIRPYDTFSEIILLTKRAGDFSFPSGHTCSSFAAAGIFFWYGGKWWRSVPLILAFLIGFSRLYLGVHYPSDVLAGGMIGFGISSILHFSLKKLQHGERYGY